MSCVHTGLPFSFPISPSLGFFFFFLCQNGERHHKGHGHGFPLVWLNEKVRWGHHEMAVRPSHRPHRDPSPCITLKWHRLSPSGAALTRTSRVPWAPVTLSGPPSVPSTVCKENRATNCGAKTITCVKLNFLEHRVGECTRVFLWL